MSDLGPYPLLRALSWMFNGLGILALLGPVLTFFFSVSTGGLGLGEWLLLVAGALVLAVVMFGLAELCECVLATYKATKRLLQRAEAAAGARQE